MTLSPESEWKKTKLVPAYVIKRAVDAIQRRSDDVWLLVQEHNKRADMVNIAANPQYHQKIKYILHP